MESAPLTGQTRVQQAEQIATSAFFTAAISSVCYGILSSIKNQMNAQSLDPCIGDVERYKALGRAGFALGLAGLALAPFALALHLSSRKTPQKETERSYLTLSTIGSLAVSVACAAISCLEVSADVRSQQECEGTSVGFLTIDAVNAALSITAAAGSLLAVGVLLKRSWCG